MSNSKPTVVSSVKRADLHCHSIASTEADEAALIAIGCPESYSQPEQVYAQAQSRGMNFFTITDHDSVDGVAQILHLPNVLTGEEVTCYFPEDGCKMHVLVWGLTREDHAAIQAVASDIYQVARYIEEHNLAHSVAHPVYRQNDVLERWHLERLILMFKGFECLNGAHSPAHRVALETLIDGLTPQQIAKLAADHKLPVRWDKPWIKSRTAGSDDHALLNVGRTWTEFPAEVETVEQLLDCLRTARCQPGGEAGSSVKLAHNFLGVASNYAANRLGGNDLMQMLVGTGRPLRRRDALSLVARQKLRRVGRRVRRGITRGLRLRPAPKAGSALFSELCENSISNRILQHPELISALRNGRAPLAEHDALFQLIASLQRDVTQGIFNNVAQSLTKGDVGGILDSLSAIAAQQFLMAPYYFALFHQNREREHFPRITGKPLRRSGSELNVGLFSDSLDSAGTPSDFVSSLSKQMADRGQRFCLHTCGNQNLASDTHRRHFKPLASIPTPLAAQPIAIPPIAEVLEWADRQQFDVIHADTCGPMGLIGWLVAKMLRVPFVAGFNIDLPGIVRAATGDFRLSMTVGGLAGWFYQQADLVLVRSRRSGEMLKALGVDSQKVSVLPAEYDAEQFQVIRDMSYWQRRGVRQPRVLLYRGPVAAERNVSLLASAFERLCTVRKDVALVIVGDGPMLKTLQKRLHSLPVYFNPPTSEPVGDEARIARDFSASDLLLLPSGIECDGQVVIHAQACGLPVMVSDQGAASEMMDDHLSGMVLPASQPAEWADAIGALLNDEPRRQRLSRTASQRMARFAPRRLLDELLEHYAAVFAARADRCYPQTPAAAPATDGHRKQQDNQDVEVIA